MSKFVCPKCGTEVNTTGLGKEAHIVRCGMWRAQPGQIPQPVRRCGVFPSLEGIVGSLERALEIFKGKPIA